MEELRIRESEVRSVSRLIGKEQEGHERSVILVRRRKMEVCSYLTIMGLFLSMIL